MDHLVHFSLSSLKRRHGLSKDNKYPVKSLIKALNILEYLGTLEHGAALTEISKKLAIGKSTVHRLLATLIDHNFVSVDPRSSNYLLGFKILQLSGQLSRQSILIRYAEPIISRLVRDTNETCNLGVLDGDEVLYLLLKESDNPLRMSGQVGKRLPAHCTALGKVILSGLSKQEFAAIYDTRANLETPTSHTIATVAELEKHLEKVRQTGLAFDNEELYQGVVCLASPVRGHKGKIVAGMSISFPKNRIDPEKLEESKSLLSTAANDLSRELGYNGPGFSKDAA